jgi:hypothetical protein
MKRNIIKLLLISAIIIGCENSLTSQRDFQIIELNDISFLTVAIDSIYLLIPSQACFECTKNSIQLIELFGDKKNCLTVIYGNTHSRDFKILFKSELSKYSNIVMNEIEIWKNYVSDDPISIWVVFSSNENRLRYKIRLTEENILSLESVVNRINL